MMNILLSATLYVATIFRCATGADLPTMVPADDVLIPTDDFSNITFECFSNVENIYWELNGHQLQTEQEKIRSADRFIFITDTNDGTTYNTFLTVALEGRQLLAMVAEPIEVKCQVFDFSDFSSGSTMVYIFQYERPTPVGMLSLNYQSGELRLEWTAPVNLLPTISTTYTVLITNISSGNTTEYKTSRTSLLINQTVGGACQPHSFAVVAENDAGNSSTVIIHDSIPLSLNVSVIASTQRIEDITIDDNTNATVIATFQPATSCSDQFPILNYTISIEGLEGGVSISDPTVHTDERSWITVTLNSSVIPGLTVDQQYHLVITACTIFTCRRPAQPLQFATTDVQGAAVTFFGTTISLSCRFAVGSSASGCLFVFQLTNEERSDNITVPYMASEDMSNSTCDQLNNTRSAYNEVVLVYDVESDESTGDQPITATVTMETEPDNFPCPLPVIVVSSRTDGDLSTGAIVALIILSTLLVVVISLGVMAALFLRRVKSRFKSVTVGNIKLQFKFEREAFAKSLGLVQADGTDMTDGGDTTDMGEQANLLNSNVEVEDFPVVAICKGCGNELPTIRLLDSVPFQNLLNQWQEDTNDNTIELYPKKRKKTQMTTAT